MSDKIESSIDSKDSPAPLLGQMDVERKAGQSDESIKAIDSTEDVSEVSSQNNASVWGTFLGRDRKLLRKDPVVWDQGFGPWANSVGRRARDIFTPRFLICVLLGQLLSFCITTTSVVTTQLGINGWAMPVTQSLFLYFFLNLIYTPYTIYRYGFKAWFRMLYVDGWRYILLAAVDVEGNFLVIKAYQYTDLLSCMLLDAWATPACMIFAFFLVKARYHWTQILGVLVCIAGLGLLVTSDYVTDKNYPAMNKVKGDIFMLIGATMYGLSNALEEFFVRQRPLYEVVGQMGFWGCIINAAQGAGLEHNLFHTVNWSGTNIGLLAAYTIAMLTLYTGAPILFRISSSPFYNLNLLTSDFFGLCFGLGLYGYKPYWLYFVAYPLILIGLIIYFTVMRPEMTSMNVVARGRQEEKEAATGHKRVLGESKM